MLDGSHRVDEIIRSSLSWDVISGVARRSWARNEHAMETAVEFNKTRHGIGQITLPYLTDEKQIKDAVAKVYPKAHVIKD